MIGQTFMRRQAPEYSPHIEKARIERVIFASQSRKRGGDAVENARQVLSETMAIVSAIETRLEKLLAIVERAATSQQADRSNVYAQEFEVICKQIDKLTTVSSGRGSLIDSSTFALSIDMGVHGQSKIKIPHVNLTSGPQGLGLRGQKKRLLQKRTHDMALIAVQRAFATVARVQQAYQSTSRWLEAA